MRTRPWIMIILPRCCQWVACNSVSPPLRQSYEHAGALTPVLSFSFLLLSLCRPGSPEDGLGVRKSILLCLADPSPPLSSMLLIYKKAVNLKWASKCSFPTSFQALKYDIPVGTRGRQRPWIFCLPETFIQKRSGTTLCFSKFKGSVQNVYPCEFSKHQNRNYLTS